MTLPNSELVSLLERPIDNFFCLDVETYWAPGYELRKCGTVDYVRDPQFQEIGWGVKVNSAPAVWMTPPQFAARIKNVDWSRTAVLCHNSRFDGLILAERYGIKPAMWFDTLSMARALHGTTVGGSLKKLATYYGVGEKGDEVFTAKGKRLEDFTAEEYARYGLYCVNDVNLTLDIFRKMLAGGFPEVELHLIDRTLRWMFEPSFILDEPLMQTFLEEEIARKAALLARVQQEKTSLASNEQFADLLRERGVQVPMKLSPAALKKGEEKWVPAFAKSDSGMQGLLEHEDPEVVALAEARIGVKSTTNETRTQRFLRLGKGGRPLSVALNYYGAHTGRWSGSEKTNFQNLERTSDENPLKGRIRKALLAPAGKSLVVVDSGQIEPRVTAWVSGQDDLLETFRRNDRTKGDIYSDEGEKYFRKKIVKGMMERQVSKSMLIGLSYGLGWRSFSASLLAGFLGAPPQKFGRNVADEYGVDLSRFRMDDDKMKFVEEMITRTPLEERVVHCAVTEHFVNLYRKVNSKIPLYWRQMDGALHAMNDGREESFGPGALLRTVRHGMVLPNGLMLRYPGLEWRPKVEGEKYPGFSYLDGHGKKRKKTYGGSITENVVQALARIIVAEQILWSEIEADAPSVTSTHDEGVFLAEDARAEEVFNAARARFRIPPDWCAGLPLNAAGGWGKSYGETK